MVLRIPEGGLELESSARAMAALPLQAFAITLSDDVLEDMIESFQNGQGIELSLGQNPSFIYGSDTHYISRTPDSFSYDLYVTNPQEPQAAELLPNPTMGLFRSPTSNNLRYTEPLSRGAASEEDEDDVLEVVNHPDYKSSKSKSSSLQTPAVKPKPGAKKTAVSSMAGAFAMSTTALSRASSPALSIAGSPLETAVESASQQKVKDARELRAPITHSLAVREMTYDELWEKWGGDEDSKKDFRGILDKVAELDKSAGKYSMKKMFYKELDIWNHSYDSDSDRQLAIDNTAKQYDRMRIGASEPVWQKLLPFDERGKGKSLSKLQATLAKGPKGGPTSTPKIHVQKADDSTSGAASPGSRDDDARSVKSSEPMSRQGSQNKATNKKPAADPTAASKKPAAAAPKKAAAPKVSPVKSAAAAAAAVKRGAKAANGGRGPLSQELISDSDDSSEEIPLSQQVKQIKKQQPAPAPRPAKPTAPVRAPAAAPPKPRPPVKESIEPQITARPVKRARDDDDSSSSSGATPLSKKPKAKEPKPMPTVSRETGGNVRPREVSRPAEKERERERERDPKPAAAASTMPKNRVVEANNNQDSSSRGMSGSNGAAHPPRAKNTSPAKSSPLASSPPTNASDIDPAEEALIASANQNSKKRKTATDAYNDSSSSTSSVGGGSVLPRVKRQQQSSGGGGVGGGKLPDNVLDTARRFKAYYEKYETLHYQLLELENPEQQQISHLTKMRKRLEEMKREIYAGTRRSRNGSDSDGVDRR